MTTMWRKVKCTVCEYEQTDSVSYYLHAKVWKANHDLEKCGEIRKSKNAWNKMFPDTLDSLNKLSIIK
jgi:uncharacterized membrane protein